MTEADSGEDLKSDLACACMERVPYFWHLSTLSTTISGVHLWPVARLNFSSYQTYPHFPVAVQFPNFHPGWPLFTEPTYYIYIIIFHWELSNKQSLNQ